MSERNEKLEIEKLRRFLIRRFIVTLLLVGLAEFVILRILNQWFFPVLQWYFFRNSSGVESISGVQMMGVILILLLQILFNALGMILPEVAGKLTSRASQGLERYIIGHVPVLQEGLSLNQLDHKQGLLLFLAIAAMLVLILIPFAAGAFAYAWVTTREVRKIEARRDEWKREYDRRRNLMLSDIAHDLRTPITTVLGYAKALADNMVTDGEKRQEYLIAIQRKSARMEELIQLLFEYVKLDSDGFSLCRKPLELPELLRKNAAFIYSDAEAAGMELLIDIPEESCIIEADEIQFSRVIINLMTNAIRHNEKGTRILLSMRQDDEMITVYVADTGEAISPDMAKQLFEPFTMGDESRSSKGGSGLGLSIAHKVIEMHGWELDLVTRYPGYTKAFRITIKGKGDLYD